MNYLIMSEREFIENKGQLPEKYCYISLNKLMATRFHNKNDIVLVQSLLNLGEDLSSIRRAVVTINQKGLILKIISISIEINHQTFPYFISIIDEFIYLQDQKKEFILQKQREGIARAKQCGKKVGRPPIPYPKKWAKIYRAWKNKEIPLKRVLICTNLKRSTFYNLVRRYENDILK